MRILAIIALVATIVLCTATQSVGASPIVTYPTASQAPTPRPDTSELGCALIYPLPPGCVPAPAPPPRR